MMTSYKITKAITLTLGGGAGWLIAEFYPTFPLIFVAVVFIISDAWTAYDLDRRVRRRYPDKTLRREAGYFTSFAFGKVVRETIPKRLWLILMAYMAERWVFIHVDWYLPYVITGVICFEQGLSILENESSCREENESKFWRILQRVLVDKTERHFDVNLDELKPHSRVTDEQIARAREYLDELMKRQKKQNNDEYEDRS